MQNEKVSKKKKGNDTNGSQLCLVADKNNKL